MPVSKPGLAVFAYRVVGHVITYRPVMPVHEMALKKIQAAWFGIHFFLLTAVCLAGVFWLIAERSTILPSSWDHYARKIELVASWCLGKQANRSNPVRLAIATYLHAAGIQAGYTFFAPNVPSHHRLTLELIYDDGRVEYKSPRAHSRAAALRLDSLLDRLAEDRYKPVREVLVKRLAFSVWREHPEVKKIRAIFGSVNLPSVSEFEQGQLETFQPMFRFDFSQRKEQQP